MRIFKTRTFGRYADKKNISDTQLIEAVQRANNGLIDASLGHNIIKQRIAKQGKGKSSGYRSLILYQINHNSYFVAIIEKSDRENISQADENDLRKLADLYQRYDDEILEQLIQQGSLIEIKQGENNELP